MKATSILAFHNHHVYGTHMAEVTSKARRRNILWSDRADNIAEGLAHDKRFKRGVSELLERLIWAEAKRKRGIAHLHGESDHQPITQRGLKNPPAAGKTAASK
jgi:hypothetical protein